MKMPCGMEGISILSTTVSESNCDVERKEERGIVNLFIKAI